MYFINLFKRNRIKDPVFLIIMTFLISFFLSCSGSDPLTDFETFLSKQNRLYKLNLKYAEKFSADIYEKFTYLSIDSFSGNQKHRYILSEDEEFLKNLGTKYNSDYLSFIKIPVYKTVSLSSQNIAFLNALSLLDRIKGIDLRRNVSNSNIHEMLIRDKIYELGEGREIDIEKMGVISPDIVLASGTGGEYDAGNILKGFNLVLTYEWLEKNPLARAEWIKCISLFFNSLEKAETVFNNVENSYMELKEAAAVSEKSVSVLPNMVYGDIWPVPGGKSFAACFYNDANVIYPWSNTGNEGSLFLDFEAVLSRASDADIWLVNSMNINSIDDIIKTDSRYSLFSAVKTERVYNNNRNTGKYGNPYWEEGNLYPDRILSDLIKIFHPEVENSNPYYYYKKLDLKAE